MLLEEVQENSAKIGPRMRAAQWLKTKQDLTVIPLLVKKVARYGHQRLAKKLRSSNPMQQRALRPQEACEEAYTGVIPRPPWDAGGGECERDFGHRGSQAGHFDQGADFRMLNKGNGNREAVIKVINLSI